MLASAIFLALLVQSPLSLLPLAAFLILGFVGIVLLERGWSKRVVLSIAAIVLAYVWLNIYSFLPSRIFLDFPYFTLGLSHIFFSVLRLLIEAGEASGSGHIGPTEYLLCNLNLTTLVSGPIQSYADFARDQYAVEPIALGPRVIGLQLERIIKGFFKVNVVALLLHAVQNDALTELH
jgi:D-alanyl-lipoteichoic acid acyltransferase DltB (MBOAT superfamily)